MLNETFSVIFKHCGSVGVVAKWHTHVPEDMMRKEVEEAQK